MCSSPPYGQLVASFQVQRILLQKNNMHSVTRAECQAAVSAKIRKIMHEKKKRPQKQAVAIAFSMVRKASPACERLLTPKKLKLSPKKHLKH